MYRRDKNAQAWLTGANRLPTRNKVPPGRFQSTHHPSGSASTWKKPGNERGSCREDASQAKSGKGVDDWSTPGSAVTETPCPGGLGNGGVQLTAKPVDAEGHASDSLQQPNSPGVSIQGDKENSDQTGNEEKQLVLRAATPALEADEPEVESPVAPRSSLSQSAWEISIDGLGDARTPGHVAEATHDDGTSSHKDAYRATEGADIRNEIAPKHKLENVGGIIRKDPWMDEGDDDFIFRTRRFYEAFIVDWSSKICNDARPTFLEDGSNKLHWLCDVDTETGRLRGPIEQPPTFVDMEEEMRSKPSMRDHRRNWNSEYLITRENKARNKKARRLHHARILTRCETADPSHPPTPATPATPPPRKVEVNCVLRPATPSDLPGIVDIYNWEIKRGIRAWDTELVGEEDFRRVGRSCREAKLPFIVAVYHPIDLNDPNNWPSEAMWEEFKAWTASTVDGAPQFKKREPTVIGFGFMQPYDRGYGRGKHVGRTTVQMSVFVHHEYRRKRVGTAIMDRLLTHVSHLHCPGNMPHN